MSEEENNNNVNDPQAEYIKPIEQSDTIQVKIFSSFDEMTNNRRFDSINLSYEKRLALLSDLRQRVFKPYTFDDFNLVKKIITIKQAW